MHPIQLVQSPETQVIYYTTLFYLTLAMNAQVCIATMLRVPGVRLFSLYTLHTTNLEIDDFIDIFWLHDSST